MARAIREPIAQRWAALHRLPAVHNAGLELDRYVREAVGGENTALREAFQRVCLAPPPPAYEAACARWRQRLLDSPNVAACEFRVPGRLIVGLGGESVRETAVTLLRNYGVPFIPGSALKGLARRYAELELARGDPKHPLAAGGDHHQVLFGTTDEAGYLTYHDAWYVPGSAPNDRPLALDVITVHHPTYYSSRGAEGPGPWDFDDPNPVPFLSAQGSYLVVVQGPDRAWAEFGLRLLALALGEWGVGARTSSGYGRLEPVALPASPAPAQHRLVEVIRGLSTAQVKPQIAGFYQQSTHLPEPARRQVAEAIGQRIEEAGLLRDRVWANKAWVRELQDYLRAQGT